MSTIDFTVWMLEKVRISTSQSVGHMVPPNNSQPDLQLQVSASVVLGELPVIP